MHLTLNDPAKYVVKPNGIQLNSLCLATKRFDFFHENNLSASAVTEIYNLALSGHCLKLSNVKHLFSLFLYILSSYERLTSQRGPTLLAFLLNRVYLLS